MHLSLREKRNFYQNLARFMRSGVSMPAAVDKLAESSRGPSVQLFRKLRKAFGSGQSMGDAFAALQPALGEMECAAIAALERSGRLDRGLQQLSDYFEAMENARKAMLQRTAYPFFLLNFGLISVSVLYAVNESMKASPISGVELFLRHAALLFGILYALIAVLWLVLPKISEAGAQNAAVDWLLQRVFFIGKVRRAFALARFCSTYNMQLDAGINVMDGLIAAGRASRSGRISRAAENTVAQVRQGGQVGPQLAASGVFPNSFVQTFLVAEETGELDRALERLATEYQSAAVERLDVLSEWLPRLLYFGILIYFAWVIIEFYREYFARIMSLSGA